MDDWTYFAPIENAELDQCCRRDEFSAIAGQAQEGPGKFGKESNEFCVDLDGENQDFDEAEFKTFCFEYLFGESGNQNHETLALILQEIEMSITKSASEDALQSQAIEEKSVLGESCFGNVTKQVLSADEKESVIRPVESLNGENIPSELQINDEKVGPVEEKASDDCELNLKSAQNASSKKAANQGKKRQKKKIAQGGICTVCINKRRVKKNIYSHKRVHTSKGEAVALQRVDGVATIVASTENPALIVKNKIKHRCDECKFTTDQWPKLEMHKTKHFAKTIECSDCDRKFTTPQRLKVHFQASHIFKFECADCKRTAMSRNQLRHHHCPAKMNKINLLN